MASYFDTSIEFIKGVGPRRARLLQTELGIHTFRDLIQHYPFRYEDRTKIYQVAQLNDTMPHVQLKGQIARIDMEGSGRRKRLKAFFKDESGVLELIWFNGIAGVYRTLQERTEYMVFGKPYRYAGRISMVHPEIELVKKTHTQRFLQPVYSLSETLRSKYLNNKWLITIQQTLLADAVHHFSETLPQELLRRKNFISQREAIQNIHFPKSNSMLAGAQYRLKFEELFYIQLQLINMKLARHNKYKGFVFGDTGMVKNFYTHHLPFMLTDAQKRVIREIYTDMRSGNQMSRLLQGDVGSGKTIVAFMCMLLAIASGAQAALMTPTEILAIQHYNTLTSYASSMNISIALLTGSTKKSERNILHKHLQSGEVKILVGTHAIIEDEVQFGKLGIAVIDEQHRFGVAQRSKLWKKTRTLYPHMLVMTATPIPRTLAMTLYGDLDVSVIDEMPSGRKPIKTRHRYDEHRLQINGFIGDQIAQGRQVYVVYPLIEESKKLDFKYLMDGYESIVRAFPDLPISILHGNMTSEAKKFEMDRFVRGETSIMVATTVIEVGVDVPNASVMVIESAERFGLLQLHQLRGRVGRGTQQAYCLLVTSHKLSDDSRTRMKTMERTSDGFEIAEVDLKLRGPGDLVGTQQSGSLNLLIADLVKDAKILQEAREEAMRLIASDPELNHPDNRVVSEQMTSTGSDRLTWGRIS